MPLGLPRALTALIGLTLFVGCPEDPADPPTGRDAGLASAEAGPADAAFAPDVRVIPRRDGGLIVHHDAGAPPTCTSTCECPQGLACLQGLCKTAGVGPVWCCSNKGCPIDEVCLDVNERPGRCPTLPDAGPDAGMPDLGAGRVGSACDFDTDCDQGAGLTCWSQNEPPFLWGGYCTVDNCTPTCPANSVCINFAGANPLMGCMASCTTDNDCRSDAYCFVIPNSTIRICRPDCRDDLFDCAPRDGTTFCSPMTGQCEPTPMQNPMGAIGDPCSDNRDCGAGQVCLGEFAWGLPGGMCTRVCGGLPEATPCSGGETCNLFAGINMCFLNCDAMAMCANRPGAICSRLDATWPAPACLPQ